MGGVWRDRGGRATRTGGGVEDRASHTYGQPFSCCPAAGERSKFKVHRGGVVRACAVLQCYFGCVTSCHFLLAI